MVIDGSRAVSAEYHGAYQSNALRTQNLITQCTPALSKRTVDVQCHWNDMM